MEWVREWKGRSDRGESREWRKDLARLRTSGEEAWGAVDRGTADTEPER